MSLFTKYTFICLFDIILRSVKDIIFLILIVNMNLRIQYIYKILFILIKLASRDKIKGVQTGRTIASYRFALTISSISLSNSPSGFLNEATMQIFSAVNPLTLSVTVFLIWEASILHSVNH